jgi:internalin A
LSFNLLDSLPPEIGQLSQLQSLNISHNKLSELPPEMRNLNELQSLNVERNLLPTPPSAIIGVKAIRDFYVQLAIQKVDYLYEAKLLILGEGGAGKTSLANKLLHSDYNLKEDQGTTKGIDILEWGFDFDNNHRFKVNVWDFGGQEIYHATHQFFLTERSLYVLVVDTRKEDTDFYYWLNIAELLGGKSPLIIFNNEKQDRKRAIDESGLREEFLNFKEIFHANLATNRGLEDTVKGIKNYMRALPHVGNELPKTWVRIRKALEDDQRNYILYEEYIKTCETVKLFERNYQEQVLGYLHDLGVCLHFKDDPLLQRYVILKPEWGTNAVYKVLDNDRVIRKWGEFSTSDLSYIWQDDQYNNMRFELLQLMMRFKLCYQIPDTQTYIAPQLLPIEKANYTWKNNDNLQLRYRYKFMPKGILTSLIVALYDLIENQTVWRTGLIINYKDTRAEIREFYDDREIRIRIHGNEKKSLLAVIRREIDRIHQRFHRLNVHELIPCSCSECAHNLNPNFYQYDVLKKFAKDGKTIQCYNSYEHIDAHALIDDVITTPPNREKVANQMNLQKFDVFISHSSSDKALIEQITATFKSEGISYWVDNEKILPNSLVTNEIEAGIESSRHLLLCLSTNMIRSGWVRAEYTALLTPILSGHSTYSIIVLNLDDTTIKDTPPLLRNWRQTKYKDGGEYKKLIEFLRQQTP